MHFASAAFICPYFHFSVSYIFFIHGVAEGRNFVKEAPSLITPDFADFPKNRGWFVIVSPLRKDSDVGEVPRQTN